MTRLSVVVISLNEGESLRRTVDQSAGYAAAVVRNHRGG